jgi:hypothetical protein
LINDPAMAVQIGKLLVMNKVRLSQRLGRRVSMNDPAVVE